MASRLVAVATVLFLLGAGAARADDGPGFLRTTGERLRAPFTPSGVTFLGLGTVGALAGEDLERPAGETRFMEWGPLEPASDVGNAFGAGEIVLGSSLAFWAGGRMAGSDRFADFGRDLTATFAATGAWVWALKTSFHAPRPNGGPYSFPSGHTAEAFAAAATIHRHFGPRWGLAGYSLATMTAGARMEDRRHFFRDVAFGAALGLAVGGAQLPIARWLPGVGVDDRGLTWSHRF